MGLLKPGQINTSIVVSGNWNINWRKLFLSWKDSILNTTGFIQSIQWGFFSTRKLHSQRRVEFSYSEAYKHEKSPIFFTAQKIFFTFSKNKINLHWTIWMAIQLNTWLWHWKFMATFMCRNTYNRHGKCVAKKDLFFAKSAQFLTFLNIQ